MIRKAALRVGAPALLVFMIWNAYFALTHLSQMRAMSARTSQSFTLRESISNVLKDLTDMETGQRGYLLTEDTSYLLPFTAAKGRIEIDLANLRGGLANHTNWERSSESQLESLTKSKQAEMERAIDLRQRGYRHRAFMVVDSNAGRDYMEKARGLLGALSAAEVSSFTKFETNSDARFKTVQERTIAANLCLFVLTAFLFGLIRYDGRGLEREAAYSRESLAVRSLQLEKVTSALSNQARSTTSAIEVNARLLLENYGGFLPRQGHEYAEQIQAASAEMELLRQDLVSTPASNGNGKAA
jgi:CHASE3 domain sensor protein